MKAFTVTFVLILVLSLVFVTNAHQRKRRSNDALREQLMDYLLEAQRRDSLYSAEEALEKEMQRRRENDDERTYVRRKAVGLGDNPFK